MEITGRELHEAMQRGCIKDCRNCLLAGNNKCLLKVKAEWEQWAKEEHMRFDKVLRSKDE